MVAAAVGLGAGVLAACSSSTVAAPAKSRPRSGPTIPLTSSSTTGADDVGHTGHGPSRRSPQHVLAVAVLERLPVASGHATGRGQQRGLVAAAESTVLAGFGPSQDLRFSPIARNVDQGSSLAGRRPPGRSVHGARCPGPGRGRVAGPAAHRRGEGGRQHRRSLDLDPVTTASSLRPTSGLAGCHLRSLTAVALDAPAAVPWWEPRVRRADRAGLFSLVPEGMVAVGPSIPGAWKGPTEVVRLDQTAAGTSALVTCREWAEPPGSMPCGATGDLGAWTVSARTAARWRLAGVDRGDWRGGFTVSTRVGVLRSVASVIGPDGSQWTSLPPLPVGTTSVTAGPAGSYDALVPRPVHAVGLRTGRHADGPGSRRSTWTSPTARRAKSSHARPHALTAYPLVGAKSGRRSQGVPRLPVGPGAMWQSGLAS